jgi:hypothetical protein
VAANAPPPRRNYGEQVAHIGTYALAERLDEVAHIAGYALAGVGCGHLLAGLWLAACSVASSFVVGCYSMSRTGFPSMYADQVVVSLDSAG